MPRNGRVCAAPADISAPRRGRDTSVFADVMRPFRLERLTPRLRLDRRRLPFLDFDPPTARGTLREERFREQRDDAGRTAVSDLTPLPIVHQPPPMTWTDTELAPDEIAALV